MTDRERRRDIARAHSDWAWELDQDLRISHLCERFTGSVGRSSTSTMGRGLDSLGILSSELMAALERRAAFRGLPVTVDSSGGKLPFRLSGRPRFDGTGLFLGYAGTAVRGSALEPEEGRAAFLSNVGHEFRTPLNAIIGFAEVMNGELYGPLSDRYAGYARDIAQAGRHLLSLIEDVLDAAAGEGDGTLTVEDVDVDSVIDKAMRIASVSAEARTVRVVREDSGRSFTVRADERRFAQILVNLLVNAIKFSPAGGGVTVAARPAGATAVEIEVADEGPGIAPEDQTRIFDKFEQLSTAPMGQREGVGLGLAIARDFAASMDGELNVASTLGEGARFTLKLPAVA